MASKKNQAYSSSANKDRSNETVSLSEMLGTGKADNSENDVMGLNEILGKPESDKPEDKKENKPEERKPVKDIGDVIQSLEKELDAISDGIGPEKLTATKDKDKTESLASILGESENKPEAAVKTTEHSNKTKAGSEVKISIPEPVAKTVSAVSSGVVSDRTVIKTDEKHEAVISEKSAEDKPSAGEFTIDDEPNAETTNDTAQKTEETEKSVESESEKKSLDSSSPLYYVRIVGVLTAICVGIALLLAVVNNMTKDIIAENSEREKQEAILAVFPEGDSVKEFTAENGETVFIVLKDGNITGYCVDAVGSGYNGDVGVMVGVNTNGEVGGLKIVSISETPGVGSKVQNDTYLSQYIGLDHETEVGDGIDGISGATFSSRAITQAVNYAISLDVDLERAAAELGAEIAESVSVPEKANDDNGDEELNPTVVDVGDDEVKSSEEELTDVIEESSIEDELAAREAEEAARAAEEQRLAEEQAAILEEAQRKSEEAAAAAEAQRQAEEAAAAEAQRQAEEAAAAEAQRQAEEAAAAEAQRQAEEAAAAEAQRQAEAAAAAEAQRQAEEAAAAAEAQRQAEAAAAAEAQRQAEAAAAAEAQRQAEAAAAAEAQRQAEAWAAAEAQRQAEEAARAQEASESGETAEEHVEEPVDESTEEPEEEPHEIQHGESTESGGIISFKKG